MARSRRVHTNDGRSGCSCGEPQTIIIDATYLKGAPHGLDAADYNGDPGRLIGRTKGGVSVKLNAFADVYGRFLIFFMTAGQVSEYAGTAAPLDDMPKTQWLLGHRGYDADRFRDALQAKGIRQCIPGGRSPSEPVGYDKRCYRHRSRINIIIGLRKD